jgi:hypothetical protein
MERYVRDALVSFTEHDDCTALSKPFPSHSGFPRNVGRCSGSPSSFRAYGDDHI